MALERLREWARSRTPIKQPDIAEIHIKGVIDDFGDSHLAGQIGLPLLEPPTLSDDLLEFSVGVYPHNLTLRQQTAEIAPSRFSQLDAPSSRRLPFELLQSYPDILDLFTGLELPGRAGKAYSKQDGTHSAEPEEKREQVQLSFERCRHGLPMYMCGDCQAEAKRRREPKAQDVSRKAKQQTTVDVFDLLLPYLQPPIETLLTEPVLFPPNRRPYDYQITGIRFLAQRESALLGDEMGLGKTIMAIVALQLLFRHGETHRVLVLCRRSLLSVWEDELEKWAPELFVLKVRGTRADRKWMWQSDASVYMTTYETLREDVKRGVGGIEHKFDLVILDEIQEIKNPGAQKSRAVRKIRAQYRWGLSGTPLENKPEDVISIFGYLRPALFPKDKIPPPYQIKERIKPYFLRRRTADVLTDLPEKISNEIWLDLTDRQQRAYDRMYARGRASLARPDATRMHVFSWLNKLKQICNLDPESGASCKLEYLTDQLDTIVENDQKALVFSHFPNVTLRKVQSDLQQFDPALFDGSLNDTQRRQLVRSFQEDDSPRVLLISVKTGGVGLTLTRANHVFHFDHWWNPAVTHQATGRAHRIGQNQTVFEYNIFTNNTIERRIHNILAEKQFLFDTIIDDLSSEHVQGAITDEELFALFDLEPPEQQERTGRTRQTSALEQKLDRVTPAEFEELIADLYQKMGFLAKVTPQSRDQGVDVVVRRMVATGVERQIIQCKHYPNGTVGAPDVRELVGAWQSFPKAARAVLVTSGQFSKNARDLAEKRNIDLVDGLYLQQLVEKYQIHVDR